MNPVHEAEELELMEAELDGANDAAASAHLRGLLAVSADSRERFASLQKLHAGLARLPQEDPPATLHGSILRAVAPPLPEAVLARATRPQRLFGAFGWQHAVAFGLGAIAATALAWLAERPDLGTAGDPSELIGTLAPRDSGAATVDDSEFRANLASGRFRMIDRHRLPVVEFEIDAGEPVEVDFECLRGCSSFQGYAHRTGHPSRVIADDGRLTFVNYGRHGAVVFVGRVTGVDGAAVRVRVHANRTLLHSDTLEFPGSEPVG